MKRGMAVISNRIAAHTHPPVIGKAGCFILILLYYCLRSRQFAVAQFIEKVSVGEVTFSSMCPYH